MKVSAKAPKKKALVGISGGSNSAVTAALLKSQGYDVIGIHLQLIDPKAVKPGAVAFDARCCLTKKTSDAQEVCRKLDIPLTIVDSSAAFEDKVVDVFVHDILRGRLPQACIPCNREIRFTTLFRLADKMGCETVATGHHAQVFHEGVADGSSGSGTVGGARLQRAVNVQKDQSYFLFGLGQKELSRLLFPLGGFQDAMIARLAHEFGLPESSPGNPQQSCFIDEPGYVAFYESRVPMSLRKPGNIRMTDGAVLGEHRGIYAFKLGNKVKLASHVKDQDKYQVVSFDVPGHALVVGSEKDLYHSEVRAGHVNWIRPMDGLRGLRAAARVSASQREASACRVTQFENSTIRVEFDSPQRAMMAGQAIVFYDGEEVLGGAMIDFVGALPRD